MSAVQGFVNLYHVWAVFGLTTAILFGRLSYDSWRSSGGRWRSAPGETLHSIYWMGREVWLDLGRFLRWTVAGLIGSPFIWRESEWDGRRYSPRHTMLIGVTLVGIARFLTALYWSEKSRAWMEHVSAADLAMASVPIIVSIVGDVYHHFTAMPHARHRARLLLAVGVAWVAWGVMMGVA